MAGDSIRGWLVDVGGNWRFAVGAHRVVEYLLSPTAYALPRMPAHCLGVLVWREQLIPILDLGPVVSDEVRSHVGGGALRAVVLAYQESAGQPLRYGALVVRSVPVEVWASDEMARPLPEHPAALKHFARSCFAHHEQPIPVLDTTRLFATVFAPDALALVAQTGSEHQPTAAALPMETPPEGLEPRSDNDFKGVPEAGVAGSPTPLRDAGSGALLENIEEPEALSDSPDSAPALAPAEPDTPQRPAAAEAAALSPEVQVREEPVEHPDDSHRGRYARGRYWIAAAFALAALAALAAALYMY